jgi:uncharacterized protein YceK
MKTIIVLFAVIVLSGCAFMNAIKWSGSYQNGNYCLCANMDSVSFKKSTSLQMAKSISEQRLNLTQPMIDSLMKALETLKVK